MRVIIMVILNLIKKWWPAIFVGLLLGVIGIQYRMIVTRDADIVQLNTAIDNLKLEVAIKDSSIIELQKAVADNAAKVDSVNAALSRCQSRSEELSDDLRTINDIMCSDEGEPVEIVSVIEDDTPSAKETSHETKPISRTVNNKGIDFINTQFDAIK